MKAVEYTHSFELPGAAADLFPLFSPEGETKWVPGWEYVDVDGAREMRENGVFLTRSHDHGATDAIWLVKRHDPAAGVAEFYKVEPGEKVGFVRVRCRPLADERSEVEVTYRYTALSASAEAFVASFTPQAYEDFIGEWRTLLLAYLAAS